MTGMFSERKMSQGKAGPKQAAKFIRKKLED